MPVPIHNQQDKNSPEYLIYMLNEICDKDVTMVDYCVHFAVKHNTVKSNIDKIEPLFLYCTKLKLVESCEIYFYCTQDNGIGNLNLFLAEIKGDLYITKAFKYIRISDTYLENFGDNMPYYVNEFKINMSGNADFLGFDPLKIYETSFKACLKLSNLAKTDMVRNANTASNILYIFDIKTNYLFSDRIIANDAFFLILEIMTLIDALGNTCNGYICDLHYAVCYLKRFCDLVTGHCKQLNILGQSIKTLNKLDTRKIHNKFMQGDIIIDRTGRPSKEEDDDTWPIETETSLSLYTECIEIEKLGIDVVTYLKNNSHYKYNSDVEENYDRLIRTYEWTKETFNDWYKGGYKYIERMHK